MFNLPLAHLEATFLFDSKKYEVEEFKIDFKQPVDFKGQPQHEIKGGHMLINLAQMADDALYNWAKQSTLRKNGVILFQTDLGITVFEILFENAYCISLTRRANAYNGTKTELVISPDMVMTNGVEHNNFWPAT